MENIKLEYELSFLKETKNTVVYGNEVLTSIYIPKSEFEDESYPDKINLKINY